MHIQLPDIINLQGTSIFSERQFGWDPLRPVTRSSCCPSEKYNWGSATSHEVGWFVQPPCSVTLGLEIFVDFYGHNFRLKDSGFWRHNILTRRWGHFFLGRFWRVSHGSSSSEFMGFLGGGAPSLLVCWHLITNGFFQGPFQQVENRPDALPASWGPHFPPGVEAASWGPCESPSMDWRSPRRHTTSTTWRLQDPRRRCAWSCHLLDVEERMSSAHKGWNLVVAGW